MVKRGVVCALCGALALTGAAMGDEKVSERARGILTAEPFQPLGESEVYAGGPYPSLYLRGAVALVFPFDTEVESDIFGDDLELNSRVGLGYNVGAGVRLGPGPNPSDPGVGWRFEGEFAQRFYDTDSLIDDDGAEVEDIDGDIEVTTFMGNVLFDVTNDAFRGYLGFGAGFAQVDAEINGETDDTTSFALQIPFGVEIRVVENVWIDVGTRWLFVPGLDIDTDIEEFSILTADLHVGLVVEF